MIVMFIYNIPYYVHLPCIWKCQKHILVNNPVKWKLENKKKIRARKLNCEGIYKEKKKITILYWLDVNFENPCIEKIKRSGFLIYGKYQGCHSQNLKFILLPVSREFYFVNPVALPFFQHGFHGEGAYLVV